MSEGRQRFVQEIRNMLAWQRDPYEGAGPLTERIITLIGNAYAQGIVKLPNEICRGTRHGDTTQWHGSPPHHATIIALSPSPEDSESVEEE